MPLFSFRDLSTGAKTELTGSVPFDAAGQLPAGNYAVRILSAEAPQTLTILPQATVPGQVTGLIVTPGDALNDLTWTAPPDGGSPITDYIIEASSGTGFSIVADGVGTATSFRHTGLINGLTYSYRISAVNAVGTGAASAVISGTPEPASVAEANMIAHWHLGSDNPTYADLKVGALLTPGPLGSGATLESNAARIVGLGKGFLTPVADAASMTMCAVVQRTSVNSIYMGTLDNATSFVPGVTLFNLNPDDLFVARKTPGATEPAIDTASPSGFMFIGLSLDSAGRRQPQHGPWRGAL